MQRKTRSEINVCREILKEVANNKYSELDNYLILRSMATFLEIIAKDFVPLASQEFENERGN